MRRVPSWMTTAACLVLIGLAGLVAGPLAAQTRADAAYLLHAFQTQERLAAASTYQRLDWQFIGPTNISGRATDIAVADSGGHRRIYVAGATSGVWKTDDNGATWQPIFEHQATPSIGDVAVAPSNPNIVWVGTGEDNIFRASMAGRASTSRPTPGRRGRTWVLPTPERSRASSSIRPTRRSSTWPRPGTSGRTTNAASSRRPTAAGTGRRCSTGARGRARSIS